MPFLNVSSAAKAVGKNRSTIHRYMKDGRLSSVVDDTGHVKIDTSELLRVFGELKSDCYTSATHEPPNTAPNYITSVAGLQKLLQESQEREAWLKVQLEEEKQEREREREHSRELEKRLLALPEGQTKKPGLLARLFGKA
jgi:hypothetical protein